MPSSRNIRKRAKTLVLSGKLTKAQALYLSACQSHPLDCRLWLELAMLNRKMGLKLEAEQCLQHILSIEPNNHNALGEYGSLLYAQGKRREAIHVFNKAVLSAPNESEFHYQLATAYLEQGQFDLAISAYRQTIAIKPNHKPALNNLSAILTNHGQTGEAIKLLRQSLKIEPNAYHMSINLARSYLFTGDAEKALNLLEQATRQYPDDTISYSKYLLCCNYTADTDLEKVFSAHTTWQSRSRVQSGTYMPHDNSVDKKRPLRIGYLSPDLRNHSVAYFLEPILLNHNTRDFHITCYADVKNPDDTSKKLALICNSWNIVANLNDEQLCEKINNDQIDILVDLAGHTGNNRMPVFAQKPAPIAVSYLGYPNTSGLDTIDYRLTDAIADPPGLTDRYYSEKLVRLPNGFLCYHPPEKAPDILIRDNGRNIVFGSFNNLAKLTPKVIEVWAKILATVTNSRLLLKSRSTADPYTRSRLIGLFQQQGINQNQLILQGHINGNMDHLNMYNQIDIALDTFPYNGTTTTCESLWMGVPVITLCGNIHASRVSASLLSQLNLDEFIAEDVKGYVDKAIKYSSMPDLLDQLRSELRSTMRRSTLLNGKLFTKNIEVAYTEFWRHYQKNRPHCNKIH